MTTRILIHLLEDDAAWKIPILEAIKIHLPDCIVKTEIDGKSILRALSEDPPPNLLIYDINTPGMSGIEALIEIRKRRDLDWLPVVMFSSDDRVETRLTCMSAGATAFYIKPPKDIWRIVVDMVRKYSYQGEIPKSIYPPLLKESVPTFGPSVDDILGGL